MSYKARLGDREVTVFTSTLPCSAELVLDESLPAAVREVVEPHRGHVLYITRSLLGIEKITCACGSELLISDRQVGS